MNGSRAGRLGNLPRSHTPISSASKARAEGDRVPGRGVVCVYVCVCVQAGTGIRGKHRKVDGWMGTPRQPGSPLLAGTLFPIGTVDIASLGRGAIPMGECLPRLVRLFFFSPSRGDLEVSGKRKRQGQGCPRWEGRVRTCFLLIG